MKTRTAAVLSGEIDVLAHSEKIRRAAHDAIARRAYQLWERDGRRDGSDLAHWFEAERQLKAGLRPDAPAEFATAISLGADALG